MIRKTVNLRGHTVLDRLDSRSVVVDGGANRGDFARQVTGRYGCRVISLEPNPRLFAALPKLPGVSSLPYALGDRDGTLEFKLGADDEASSLVATPPGHHDTVTVQVRTLQSVMSEAGVDSIDLLKLDIEGAEIGLLLNASDELLRRVGQITVEFHDFNNYVTLDQVRSVLDRLRSLGFAVCRMTAHAHGDVLLVNRRKAGLSGLGHWWITAVERNLLGLSRIAGRALGRGPQAA
jgi:FkbM family methyltransferase